MNNPSTGRYHALDAVRGGALLLGIWVHGSMPFWTFQFWPIRDSDTTPVLTIMFSVLHIFRMAIFFFIAGFFAHLLYQKRGPAGFIKNRLTRIGIPFIVGWPIMVVLVIGGIIAYAVSAAAKSGAPLTPQPAPAAPVWAWIPLTHLWFLYVLLLLYAAILALVAVVTLLNRGNWLGVSADAVVRLLVRSPLAHIVLAAPLAAAFFFVESWTIGGGIRTPDSGLIPNVPALVGFGTAFGFGWLLHRQPDLLDVFRRWWPLNLALAAVFSVAVLCYVNAGPITLPSATLLERIAQATVYPLAVWSWTFGLVGAALAFLSKENKGIRYLADSSYWLYLIHLPVLMVPQAIFATVPWPWFVKFPLELALALAFMLATYQLLVRNTPIGGLLNGRRYGRTKKTGGGDTKTVAAAPQPSV
jgi:peptidoglycan/LPS O-acetylase OafA/YrhL